jgi:hypothetical protein
MAKIQSFNDPPEPERSGDQKSKGFVPPSFDNLPGADAGQAELFADDANRTEVGGSSVPADQASDLGYTAIGPEVTTPEGSGEEQPEIPDTPEGSGRLTNFAEIEQMLAIHDKTAPEAVEPQSPVFALLSLIQDVARSQAQAALPLLRPSTQSPSDNV